MADTGIDALETTLRLLQVQQLARRGKLREAIEAVAPGGVPPSDPLLLQTFAALVTGAGNYRMALPLWHGVELMRQLSVGHFEASTALHLSYFVVLSVLGIAFTTRRLRSLFLR